MRKTVSIIALLVIASSVYSLCGPNCARCSVANDKQCLVCHKANFINDNRSCETTASQTCLTVVHQATNYVTGHCKVCLPHPTAPKAPAFDWMTAAAAKNFECVPAHTTKMCTQYSFKHSYCNKCTGTHIIDRKGTGPYTCIETPEHGFNSDPNCEWPWIMENLMSMCGRCKSGYMMNYDGRCVAQTALLPGCLAIDNTLAYNKEPMCHTCDVDGGYYAEVITKSGNPYMTCKATSDAPGIKTARIAKEVADKKVMTDKIQKELEESYEDGTKAAIAAAKKTFEEDCPACEVCANGNKCIPVKETQTAADHNL